MAPTKTKLENPLAIHVQAIRTALLVPPVAITLPPVVRPVPISTVHHAKILVLLEPLAAAVAMRVLPVLLTLTAKSVPQLLVRIWFVPLVLTTVVRQRVFHVPVAPTKTKLGRLLANHVVLGNTTTKLQLLVKVVHQAPTKLKVAKSRVIHVPPVPTVA